jgi:hypothetical protein
MGDERRDHNLMLSVVCDVHANKQDDANCSVDILYAVPIHKKVLFALNKISEVLFALQTTAKDSICTHKTCPRFYLPY